ncbi:DUF397 domain-containing protein [Nocardia sp. GCM10030253]|uniref:DUF397 domain-containing protein n=1 Tax=Nocardia sp. GCM10030253 TaxID=3273404 RepID=UPI003630ADDF
MSSSGGWFKSSYSSDSQACVEVRFEGERTLVRDSKYQGLPDAQPILEFSRAEWSAFTATIRAVHHGGGW